MDNEDTPNKQSNSSGGGIVSIIVVIVILVVGYNFFFKKSSWQGMYESNQFTEVGVGPTFSNKEDCLAWINTQKFSPNGRYNFECGKNCKQPQTAIGPYRCEETVN